MISNSNVLMKPHEETSGSIPEHAEHMQGIWFTSKQLVVLDVRPYMGYICIEPKPHLPWSKDGICSMVIHPISGLLMVVANIKIYIYIYVCIYKYISNDNGI